MLNGLALCTLVATSALFGLPVTDERAIGWVGLFALIQGRGAFSARVSRFVRDWIPLFAALAVYALVGYYAARHNPHVHFRLQEAFDRDISFGRVPTIWLQQHLYAPGQVRVWDLAATLVYLSHFFAVFAVGLVLWHRCPVDFRRFRSLYLVTSLAGFITYALYPAAPPWIAFGHASPHVYRVVNNVLHFSSASTINAHGLADAGRNNFFDPVAAVPSMHAAYPLMLCLFLWSRTRRLRPLLVAYTLAMAFVLIYTGEHYVFDVLVGWLYAVALFVAWRHTGRWWRAKQASRAQASSATDARSARERDSSTAQSPPVGAAV